MAFHANSQFFKATALINQISWRTVVSTDRKDNWIALLSFGFFIMLFALFFIIVPNYYDKVSDFFNSFKLQEVASNVLLPAPTRHHQVVYETVMRFCLVFGLFQFFVLALRFYFGSSIRKMAETISNIVMVRRGIHGLSSPLKSSGMVSLLWRNYSSPGIFFDSSKPRNIAVLSQKTLIIWKLIIRKLCPHLPSLQSQLCS